MKRRTYLALVAAASIPLAGCSGGGGGGEDDTGDDSATSDGSSTSTDGNSTDDADGVDDGDTGGDTDGQSDEQSDGGDDPTEEELAQEDVDAAQSALSDAVSELESQGDGSLSSGDGVPVTAAVSGLSAGPVRDELSSVQSAIDDAREHETTGDQDDTLAAIESAAEWLHAVLDAHQPVRDLYLEANYAVEDYVADADPNLQAVRRAADQAQSSVDDATDPYATPEAGGIDAITTDGVEAQVDRLTAELESGRSVADAIEELQTADDLFYTEWAESEGVDDVKLENLVEARDTYSDTNGTGSGLSASFEDVEGYVTCYAPPMSDAAENYRIAINEYRADANESGREYSEATDDNLETADGCSFDWSG